MTRNATAIRNAFHSAYIAAHHTNKTTALVGSALKRHVGLVTRKTMWSIQRGKR